MKKIFSYHSINTDLASFLLRLVFGGLMIYHGYSKLSAYEQMVPMFPDLIGIGSKLSLILAIFAEFICGIFIVFGFITRLSVIPIFITMIVAYFLAHGQDAFQVKELAFSFLLLSLVVFTLGSGKYSIDSVLFKERI